MKTENGYCRGYLAETTIPENATSLREATERLVAVNPDGSVYESVHLFSEMFDDNNRNWKRVDLTPEEVATRYEFIGNYPPIKVEV